MSSPRTTVTPRLSGLRLTTSGVEQVSLDVGEMASRRTAFGMQCVASLALSANGKPWLELASRCVVDSGPFYLRQQIVGSTADADGFGTLEVIRPDRIDLHRHRPLVRMRVTRPERNSFWLPLFEGSAAGRVRRMVPQGLAMIQDAICIARRCAAKLRPGDDRAQHRVVAAEDARRRRSTVDPVRRY